MSSARQRRVSMDRSVVEQAYWGTPAETLDEMRRQAPRRTGLIWACRVVLSLIAVLIVLFLGAGWFMYGGVL